MIGSCDYKFIAQQAQEAKERVANCPEHTLKLIDHGDYPVYGDGRYHLLCQHCFCYSRGRTPDEAEAHFAAGDVRLLMPIW